MALKEKDFTDLGFTNCTRVNEIPERTKLLFQLIKPDTNLFFSRLVTDVFWQISDGRARVNRIYCDAIIETPFQLQSLVTLYTGNLERVSEVENG